MGKRIEPASAMPYCGGDESLYRMILSIYCSELETRIAKLESSLAENDLAGYGIEIHALKSTSLNIGCQDLYDAALALEKAAKTSDGDFVREHHTACMELYKEVVAEGYDYLAEYNS